MAFWHQKRPRGPATGRDLLAREDPFPGWEMPPPPTPLAEESRTASRDEQRSIDGRRNRLVLSSLLEACPRPLEQGRLCHCWGAADGAELCGFNQRGGRAQLSGLRPPRRRCLRTRWPRTRLEAPPAGTGRGACARWVPAPWAAAADRGERLAVAGPRPQRETPASPPPREKMRDVMLRGKSWLKI